MFDKKIVVDPVGPIFSACFSYKRKQPTPERRATVFRVIPQLQSNMSRSLRLMPSAKY